MRQTLLDTEGGSAYAPVVPTYEPGPRRQVILKLLIRGEKTSTIAELLGISRQSVQRHRAELQRRGLLPKPEEVSA